MPASRCLPASLIVAAIVVVAACGGTSVATTAPATPVPTAQSMAPTAGSPSQELAPSAAPIANASIAPSLEGQVVFEDSGQDFHHSQIWLESADGSNLRQLVMDDATDNSASLSPTAPRWYSAGASPIPSRLRSRTRACSAPSWW